jgi:hypothetical protein
VTTEVRQPSERLIATCPKLMIDAHVALILVVDFVRGPAVVVRGSGICRKRIPFEQ